MQLIKNVSCRMSKIVSVTIALVLVSSIGSPALAVSGDQQEGTVISSDKRELPQALGADVSDPFTHEMEGWYPPDLDEAPETALKVSPGEIGSVAGAFVFPNGPTAPTLAPEPMDPYSKYDPQSTCDPTAKTGASYLLNLAINYYGQGRSSGITRACNIGGVSEHKEGRAFDWAVNVNNPAQKVAGDQFVEWLTARGPDGKVGYQARRLGVMYIIWNRQIWSNTSANATWRVYTGPVPHTDHVHVSMSWDGAFQRNSWWTGRAIPTALPPNNDPIGRIDSTNVANDTITITGWSLDPDTTNPIDVHVYVDSASWAVQANLSRPDIGAAYGKGNMHGFTHTVKVTPGPHKICIYGINSPASKSNPQLECKNVVVPGAFPIGNIDSVISGNDYIAIKGWALDPDTTNPIDVHVYVDGDSWAWRADQSRPDVGAAYGKGNMHGYTYITKATPGPHKVCVYAMNNVAGEPSVLSGCKSVVVGRSPIGGIDSVTVENSSVTVNGWTLDPDTNNPIAAHVYVGSQGGAVLANTPRPDISAKYGKGEQHGFSYTTKVNPGVHNVCAYGINSTTQEDNSGLGCKTVTVGKDTPPDGRIDHITSSNGSLMVSGWAVDPDTDKPIDVHIYDNGVGIGVVANQPRLDIGSILGKGNAHGYSLIKNVDPGLHNVCAYAINATHGGENPFLGCKTVRVGNDAAPIGGIESLTSTNDTLTITGWALDADTTNPIDVHIYDNGVGVGVVANKTRHDINTRFGKGSQHGFTFTHKASPGLHNVCIYGINTRPGGENPFLGCKSVTVGKDVAPIGSIETLTATHSSLTVNGWILDPNTNNPIDVHIYVDGLGVGLVASNPRLDVGSSYGRGNLHGYSLSMQASPGLHEVCVYAINSVHGGENSHIGCRQVAVR